MRKTQNSINRTKQTHCVLIVLIAKKLKMFAEGKEKNEQMPAVIKLCQWPGAQAKSSFPLEWQKPKPLSPRPAVLEAALTGSYDRKQSQELN